jgi:hypothetical protein
MGTMANNADRRKVVRGHGTKGRQHKIELKTFEDPTIVIDAGWQNLPLLELLIFLLEILVKKIHFGQV